MFKNKKTYIVGIILFTVILIADIAIYFMAPSGARGGGRPSFNAESFDGEMPEGFDASQMPDRGEMPEGFDASQMPENGEMPEGFDASQMPDRGEMPEGFEGRMPSGGPGNGGFMSAIRSAFWIILIICILGDAGCVFMLLRISKKKDSTGSDGDAADAIEEAEKEAEESTDETRPRRDKTNVWLSVIAIVLVAAVTISNLSFGSDTAEREAQMAVLEDKATVGDITSVFSGSGTLQNGTAEAIEIPASVRVTSYKVQNGDTVSEGDVIAKVNKDSVLSAIYEIQALIEEMDEEIAEVQNNTIDSTVTARAGGRVKAIYAKAGKSVTNTMYKSGALMIISLGGSMSVEITTEESVSVGQEVYVKLSDGTKIAGKVQQAQNKKVIVTISDKKGSIGAKVIVLKKGGKKLGTGKLEVSSALKVTGYTGSVSKIHVSVGDVVDAGDTLLTLTGAKDQSRYQELLSEREKLTEMESRLASWYKSGSIKADKNGIISQMEETSDSALKNMSYTKTTKSTVVTLTSQTSNTYAGKVTKVSYGALLLSMSEQDVTGMDISELEKIDEKLFTVQKQYSPALDVPVYVYENKTLKESSVNALQQGDRVLLTVENGEVKKIEFMAGKQEAQNPSPGGTQGGTQGETPGGTPGGSQQPNITIPDGMTQNGGNMGNMYPMPQEEEEEKEYLIETESLCAVIPTETMSIQISVDELDILSLEAGQTAMVTLDAVPGQEFEGSVKKLSSVGSNEDGGGAKYTVTMEIPRTEQMLSGMNASVKIEVGRQEGVLTVPAAAVYEDGNRAYVYTKIDKDTEEPTNPVEVTTGASDGTNIEILSGELSEGDTVCYQYADSIVYRMK